MAPTYEKSADGTALVEKEIVEEVKTLDYKELLLKKEGIQNAIANAQASLVKVQFLIDTADGLGVTPKAAVIDPGGVIATP